MKQSKSLSLGHAYSQIDQLLNMEQELSEVTFHYGAGVRLHLDSDILGIRHAKELLAGFLYKCSCPRVRRKKSLVYHFQQQPFNTCFPCRRKE